MLTGFLIETACTLAVSAFVVACAGVLLFGTLRRLTGNRPTFFALAIGGALGYVFALATILGGPIGDAVVDVDPVKASWLEARVAINQGSVWVLSGAVAGMVASCGSLACFVRRTRQGANTMQWLEPWLPIVDQPLRAGLERELHRELGDGHQLQGVLVRAIARRQDCDDVLFALDDGTGRVAVVHLTWTQNPPDRPPWPTSEMYSSLQAWAAERMRNDHNDFQGDQRRSNDVCTES